MGTEDEAVLLQRRGSILTITLNRPRVRNAVNLAVAEGIAAALDRLDADDDVAAAVLTGSGAGFCSGLDLGTIPDGPAPHVGSRGFGGMTRLGAAKPIIAAVEGFALAGGFEIALACDLIVAGRGAIFGLPEVKRALVADAGGLLRLPRRLPYHLAMEMALTGEPFGADRLAQLGLVNQLSEDGAALDAALELAERVTVNAPLAVRATKQIIASATELPLAEAWDWQQAIADPVFDSEDAAEGSLAFLEKRDPVWLGR
jgi:enoyl-CoA hydratase